MQHRLSPTLLLLAALALSSCAGGQRGRSTDLIDGLVVAQVDGNDVPVARVHVAITLVSDEDLVGVGTTNFAGRFIIDELSSALTQRQEPLRRDQAYSIKMEAPSHYILTQTFTYGRGAEQWTFPLEPKDNSLPFDVEAAPVIPPDDERTIVLGAPPRRGTR